MSQGKMHIRSTSITGTLNCLVVPEASPQDWYFQPFPTREVAEDYAREYDLEIVEQQEQGDDDQGS